MHKALHPRDNMDKLYASTKEGKKRLCIIEDCVDPSIRVREVYIQKSKERIITAASSGTDNMRRKNYCMYISSDKPAKSHASRLGHG